MTSFKAQLIADSGDADKVFSISQDRIELGVQSLNEYGGINRAAEKTVRGTEDTGDSAKL